MKTTIRILIIAILLFVLFSMLSSKGSEEKGLKVSLKDTTEFESVVTEISKRDRESDQSYIIYVEDFDASLNISKRICELKGFDIGDSIETGDTISYRIENKLLEGVESGIYGEGSTLSMVSLSTENGELYSIEDYNETFDDFIGRIQSDHKVVCIFVAILIAYNVIVLTVQLIRNKKRLDHKSD